MRRHANEDDDVIHKQLICQYRQQAMTGKGDCQDGRRHGDVIDNGVGESQSRHLATTESDVGGRIDVLEEAHGWSVDLSDDSVAAHSQQQDLLQQQQPHCDEFRDLHYPYPRGFNPDQHYDYRICNQTVTGFEEFPQSHNCVFAFSLQYEKSWTPLHPAVYGFVHPVVVAATMVTNCLVCAVLLRHTMRTPTSILLVAMAVSDAMTSLLPTPFFIAFYTLGLSNDYTPYDWCLPFFLFTEHLPTVFHTASCWLTVALAAQRYVYVCHSSAAKRLCTVRNMLRVIAVVYAIAFAAQLPRLIDMKVGRVLVPSQLDPSSSTWYDGCYIDYIPFVSRHIYLYFGLYYWLRVIFFHLIPCTSLIVLNAVLAHTMSVARRRRSQLLSTSRRAAAAVPGNHGPGSDHRRQRSEYRRLGDGIATTLMLIVVVGLLLAVELPLACFLILMTLENTWGYAIVPEEVTAFASLIINLLIVCSYPVNFFIYCGMSRQFRQAFGAMFSSSSSDSIRPEVGHHPGGDGDANNRRGREVCASGGGLRVPEVGFGRGTAGGDALITADDGGSRLDGSPCTSMAPRIVEPLPAEHCRTSTSLFARWQRRSLAVAGACSPDVDNSATPVVLLTACNTDEVDSQSLQCISIIDNGTPSSQSVRCHDNELPDDDTPSESQRPGTNDSKVECTQL